MGWPCLTCPMAVMKFRVQYKQKIRNQPRCSTSSSNEYTWATQNASNVVSERGRARDEETQDEET